MRRRWVQDRASAAFVAGIGAVLVAAMLRIWVWWAWAETQGLFPDSVQYLQMAEEFPRAYATGDFLSFLRPPTYPAFLSVFGSVSTAMLVQVGLSIATVIVVWRWTAAQVSELAGTVAAWVIAIEPSSIVHGALVLSETLFTLLLLVGAILAAQSIQHRSTKHAALAGLLVGLATLTRPISTYLGLVLGFVVWMFHRRQRMGLMLAVVAITVTGAWVTRNVVLEDLPAVSRIEAMNLYYWRAAGALAQHEGRAEGAVRYELETHMDAQPWTTLGERHRREQSLALQILAEHPIDYVRSSGPKALLMILGTTSVAPQIETTFGMRMPRDSIVAFMFLVVYAAAAVGTVQLWRSNKTFTIVALTVFVYLIALSFGPEVYERFRVPWWPYVALLAGGVTVRPLSLQADPV